MCNQKVLDTYVTELHSKLVDRNFYEILSAILACTFHHDTQVGIAAASGTHDIHINTEAFMKYSDSDKMFIVIHELLHLVFEHPEQIKTVAHPEIFNAAADIIINAFIENDLYIPHPWGSLWSVAEACRRPRTRTVMELYKEMIHDTKGQRASASSPLSGTPGEAQVPATTQGTAVEEGSSDYSKNAGTATDTTVSLNAKRAFKQLLTALPIVRSVTELYSEMPSRSANRVVKERSWSNSLRSAFPRLIENPSNAAVPTRFSRRMPGRTKLPVYTHSVKAERPILNIAVCIDVSGSIDIGLVKRFVAETLGIWDDAQPNSIHVIAWSTRIVKSERCESKSELRSALNRIKVGGGTSLNCVNSHLLKLNTSINVVVVFTDFYFNTPKSLKGFPRETLWVSFDDTKPSKNASQWEPTIGVIN